MTITLVAAIAKNGVIGRDGGLPWPPTGDLALFKRLTMGHVLVMGRRTYDSIGRPLPGRTTVVVTRQPGWATDGVITAGDLESALELASKIDDEVFVVGGAEVYEAALPYADQMVLTHVDQEPRGDRMFPPVDWAEWLKIGLIEHDGFAVATYVRTVR